MNLGLEKIFALHANPQEPIMQLDGANLPYRKIVITYDDGPAASTLPIAQYLQDEGISATFFVRGCQIQGQSQANCEEVNGVQYPINSLEQIVALGHQVGNHGFSHNNLAKNPGMATQDILVNQQLLDPYIKDSWYFFRAPYGSWGLEVAEKVHQHPELDKLIGPIYWDIEASDWTCPAEVTAQECAQRYYEETLKRPNQCGIVLFHDRPLADPDSLYAYNVARNYVQLLKTTPGQPFEFISLAQAIIELSMAPEIKSMPSATAQAKAVYIYDLKGAGFPWPTYTLLSNPAGMTINRVTGQITWVPRSEQKGDYLVNVQASNLAGTDVQAFNINVTSGS